MLSTTGILAPTSAPADAVTVNPLAKFLSAKVSFSFKPEDQYEQGGILVSLIPTKSSSSSAATTSSPPKWIKAGIEYYNNVPRIGTVATDNYSDWSLNPVSGEGEWTTLLIERGLDEMGYSFWVYQVLASGEKIPIREICWVYGIGEEWEVKAEAYACKPGEGKPLTVQFKDFDVKWE
jgi:uncharacterized protein